jgi:4-aminobutyrate aminotransferase-like enzyme
MSIGHTSPAVLKAVKEQSRFMIHGMGDVHPNEVKVLLGKKLSEITPGNLSMSIFSSTGFEAVESALKTAVMHTKKTGVIAFEGAYHGLGYGTLSVTHRSDFRKPFEKQVAKFGHFAPYPDIRVHGNKAVEHSMKAVKSLYKKTRRSPHPVGAVLVEPIQGRGGVMVPPPNFMKELRAFCDETKTLLIADEVFTGFGRTGFWFASQKSDVIPDIMCLGKGMGAGFPISACIASARVMYSWGASTGDAIHTSTFLGHPLGCAVALAVIREIEEKKFVERSREMGDLFKKELYKLKERYSFIGDVRGSGLMIGIEFNEPSYGAKTKKPAPGTERARRFVGDCLKRGIVLLGSGPDHNVVSVTPPFVITPKDIQYCAKQFDEVLKKF